MRGTSALQAEIDQSVSPWPEMPEIVDLWIISLPALAARSARFARFGSMFDLLSEEERSRARRFRYLADTRRYVLSHVVLRLLLSRYCQRHPASLRFVRGPWGKPLIDSPDVPRLLHFNLSHSADFAAIAVSHCSPVGIDIEQISDACDPEDVVRVFTPGEAASLRATPVALRQAAFFRCWTRKEAYLKARGDGLCFDPARFEVTLEEPPPARWLSVEGDAAESARWRLFTPRPPDGYALALVTDSGIGGVRLLDERAIDVCQLPSGPSPS